MKSNLWAILGFIMIVVMVLSSGFVIANEFNLVAGSPGLYLNPVAHINAYRVFCVAVIFLGLSILNVSGAGKLK